MKAIYAFSGDPITFGHLDIINRASKVFDELIIAIGHNSSKKYTFTLKDRVDMAIGSVRGIKKVRVVSFSGLLVDFAYLNGISMIIRGIRNGRDFDYENELYLVNASQKLQIDTWFLPCKQNLSHVSSSAVKALQLEQGLVHEYVPIVVKEKLEQIISRQYIIGITGEIGSGKTYTGEGLVKASLEDGAEAHNIDMDKLGHDLLEGSDPLSKRVQLEISEHFGIAWEAPGINRKILGDIVFQDPHALKKLNEIMKDPLIVKLRKEIYGKRGFIFINSALLAEASMGYLCNNCSVVVNVDKEIQKRRLTSRGLSEDQIKRRLTSQYNFYEKLNYFQRNDGNFWISGGNEDNFYPLYLKLKSFFRTCAYMESKS